LTSDQRTSTLTLTLHHIGVQTTDFDNSVAWYKQFFGCHVNWTLDKFSELTLSRLPGIQRLAELAVGEVRFHVFDRSGLDAPPLDVLQFQHVCLRASSADELRRWRDRWNELRDGGEFSFTRPDLPTDIVTDADGIQSFYAFDVNGLEFEFTYLPEGI
jgi:catechol 2,3-dioxygenase-like lactoylglutathione lyase family enzyme